MWPFAVISLVLRGREGGAGQRAGMGERTREVVTAPRSTPPPFRAPPAAAAAFSSFVGGKRKGGEIRGEEESNEWEGRGRKERGGGGRPHL